MSSRAKPSLSWLIVLTFPNGGSTAFARLLLSARGTVALHRNAEGQWLLPELSADSIRWNRSLPFDKSRLRTVWTAEAERAWQQSCPDASDPLVIEKSPPNMCRHAQIRDALAGMPTHLAVLTRDPYATCASWNRRYGRRGAPPGSTTPDDGTCDEVAHFETLGTLWLQRARMLLDALPSAITSIAYEDLTRDPQAALAPLVKALPVLRGVHYEAPLRVKDYAPQTLRNFNEVQRALLKEHHVAAISRALRRDRSLVEALGYGVI